MDEWLEKWLADGRPIDLQLSAMLTPHRYGIEYATYEDGARDFLALVRLLDRLPATALGWTMKGFRLWDQEKAYVADAIATAATLDYADEDGSIGIMDDAPRFYGSRAGRVYYAFNYAWGLYATRLSAEFEHLPRDLDFTAVHMLEIVDAITRWKRPQHLEFGPADYFHLHHPLDRARRGIRWVGWVPFALTPSDVPEAEIVRPMNGGTAIATQSALWQVFEHHPLHAPEAIARAQEVELRLNALGVLPTAVELDRGDWGQGG